MENNVKRVKGVGASIVEGGLRAVLASGGLGLLSLGVHVPVESGIYVGALVIPAMFVERWANGRGTRAIVALVGLLWVLAFASVALCHFQAVYAHGVFTSRQLAGGASAVADELARLAWRDDDFFDLPLAFMASPVASAVAVALVAEMLAEPLRQARGWLGLSGHLNAWIPVFLVATVVSACAATIACWSLLGVLDVAFFVALHTLATGIVGLAALSVLALARGFVARAVGA